MLFHPRRAWTRMPSRGETMRLFLAAAFVAFSFTAAWAHPGGRDANGCHTERATGTHHCHEPAAAASAPKAPRSAAAKDPIVGTASVIDGDTIDIHGQRFRLHGIDAPESKQTCLLAGQPVRCGQQAALALADKIGRSPVSCVQKDVDRYGRIVAVCSARGENLNAWLVQSGHAMAYRAYSKDYVAEEASAKAEKFGIWATEFQPPWEWRKARR